MAAGQSAPLRRISEPPLECRGVLQSAKAIPDRVFRQIDVHVPLEVAAFEPVQNVHGRFVEGQRDLVGKVPVDLEDDGHVSIENG